MVNDLPLPSASSSPDILCIGSVLWDVVGRANVRMKVGHDVGDAFNAYQVALR